MHILHTEASNGWGGQEIRILREALGMTAKGHHVVICAQKGAKLIARAKAAGVPTEEVVFTWKNSLATIWQLIKIIRKYHIDRVNTHSSLDAWMGGVAARLTRKKVIRTRHLSTPVRPGLNSYFLYNVLADSVITTCEDCAVTLRRQASLSSERCRSIPTGINPSEIHVNLTDAKKLRQRYGIGADDVVVGTLCVLRSWKGIDAFLEAAARLRHHRTLKWLVVGDGPCFSRYVEKAKSLAVDVIFTGHLENPLPALAAMDVFVLLSTANEGVSQSSLQAAYLQKPLITTDIGGLKEVSVPGETGFLVPCNSPDAVANAVTAFLENPALRKTYGRQARHKIQQQFLWSDALDAIEACFC